MKIDLSKNELFLLAKAIKEYCNQSLVFNGITEEECEILENVSVRLNKITKRKKK
jgi:hypothetical protein